MTKAECDICHKETELYLETATNSELRGRPYIICSQCHKWYFTNVSDKTLVLDKAFSLSRTEKIPISYAINVARKRYSLKEARRRLNLKKSEQSGKSVDAYDVLHRLPGNYEDSKK